MMKSTFKLTATAMALTALTMACAKKREAAFAETDKPLIFDLTEFGDVNGEKTSYSFRTLNDKKSFNFGEGALAINEKDIVSVDQSGLNVPSRLVPMFKGLQISAEGGREYKVVFAVDREFVTAYRSVGEGEQLSILDKELETTAAKIQAEIEIQKGKNAGLQLKAAREARQQALTGAAKIQMLVPIFKYKHDGLGVVERKRNDAGDETTVLQLRATAIEQATHIKLDVDGAKRLMVADDAKALQNIYLIDRLVKAEGLKAGQVKAELGLPTGLADDADVKLTLDDKSLIASSIGADGALKPVAKLPIVYVVANSADIRQDGVRVTNLIFDEVPNAVPSGLVKVIRSAGPTAKPAGKGADAAEDAK